MLLDTCQVGDLILTVDALVAHGYRPARPYNVLSRAPKQALAAGGSTSTTKPSLASDDCRPALQQLANGIHVSPSVTLRLTLACPAAGHRASPLRWAAFPVSRLRSPSPRLRRHTDPRPRAPAARRVGDEISPLYLPSNLPSISPPSDRTRTAPDRSRDDQQREYGRAGQAGLGRRAS